MEKRIVKFIQELELDLIEYTGGSLKEKKKRLPITDERKIQMLIYNLLVSKKWLNKMSGNDYKMIMDEFFRRIKENNK